jgi:hypothetical protein
MTAAFAALGSVVAVAAPSPGTYSGKIEGAKRISLKVDGKTRLVRIARTGLVVKCPDGSSWLPIKITTTMRVPLPSDGKFVIKQTQEDIEQDGHRFRIAGTVKSTKASGTLKESGTFDSNTQPDPNGSMTCSTGKLRWSAKLQD